MHPKSRCASPIIGNAGFQGSRLRGFLTSQLADRNVGVTPRTTLSLEVVAGHFILRRVLNSAGTAITASTRYCAVLGSPIRHSASPAMQNAGFTALGLDWRYLAFEVKPAELEMAIAGAKAMRFIGLNLTVPHKILAVPMVDALDESAKAWGAVNTIRFEARATAGDWKPIAQMAGDEIAEVRSCGFNTDADAIVRSVREDLGLDLRGTRVLILGAGGAGRVAALRLAAEGVRELFLSNRTISKAEEIAREIAERYPGAKAAVGYPKDRIDLVLNATSLGLRNDDPSPYDATQFSLEKTAAVYDMIYRPVESKLLRTAKGASCRTANGLGMLLYQGTRALEIWSGRSAPIDAMRRALEKEIYGKSV